MIVLELNVVLKPRVNRDVRHNLPLERNLLPNELLILLENLLQVLCYLIVPLY